MVSIYSLRPYSFVQKKEKFWDFVVQKKIPPPLWAQSYAFGLTPPPPPFYVRTTWMTPIENYLLVYKLVQISSVQKITCITATTVKNIKWNVYICDAVSTSIRGSI